MSNYSLTNNPNPTIPKINDKTNPTSGIDVPDKTAFPVADNPPSATTPKPNRTKIELTTLTHANFIPLLSILL